MPVTRRGFVQAFLLAPASLIGRRLSAVLAGGPAPGTGTAELAYRLACCVGETESARALGRAYVASAPSEASLEALVIRLWPPGLDPGAGPAAEATALRKTLTERSRGDFAAGRMVSVDGWLLSETEARLCALTALLPAAG